MNLKKLSSLFLSFALLLSSGALADDTPDTSLGGTAADRPPDNSTKAVDELGTRSALSVSYTEGRYTMTQNITGDYEVELREGLPVPEVGEQYNLGGIRIQCGAEAWDEETALGNSAVVLNQLADETTPVVFGGETDYYKAPDNKLYNSVLVLTTDEDEKLSEDATETAPGVAFAFNGTSLTMENVYLETSGTGRPAVHIPSPTRDSNTSQLGDLVCMDSTVKSHDTRAMLLMGGDVWFLNSTALTNAWGALSFDNTTSTMYVVNSCVQNIGTGGYAVYDAAGCEAYIYGSEIMGGNVAVTVCRDAKLVADTLDNTADSAAAPYEDTEKLLEPSATDGETRLIAYNNPVVIHADMSGPDSQASAYLYNAYISTLEEDIKFDDGTSYSDWTAETDALSDLSEDYTSGACVLLRSHNGKVIFDNCELHSRTDVLVHSLYVYDSMASGIYPQDGAEYVGDRIVFRNTEAEGNILHEDYMRKMELSLENTSLTGSVASSTLTGWNTYWTDAVSALAADGDSEKDDIETDWDAILSGFIHDETYETVWGVRMSMDEDSSWCVTARSNLYSFTMEDGAEVTAPVGMQLAIYINCPMSNNSASFDITGGTRITSFEPDTEYTGVVIVVEDPQTAGLSLDEETLAALGITTEEYDGNYDVSLSGLLDMLGGDVTYDEETGTITVTDESGLLGLIMGSQTE